MLSRQLKDLLLRHPGLVIETKNGVTVHGLVRVEEKRFHLKINCPQFPKLKDFTLLVRDQFEWKKFTEDSFSEININLQSLDDLINNIAKLFSQTVEKDNDLSNEDIKNNVDNNHSNDKDNVETFYAEIASLYNEDLYEIQLNAECTIIRFCKFSLNEQHYLEIQLPSLAVSKHSLPDCLELPKLLAECIRLTDMVTLFQKFIHDLQPFYDNFIGIDELCHVVQPEKPTTKHNYRLFTLSEFVFLKLVIADPFAPIASMQVDIIGPTREVEKLRRTYSEGLRDWDAELDILKNLLRIFDLLYFPMPSEETTDNDDVEKEQKFCNICYSYRRLEPNVHGGCDVPVVSCDNPQCTLIFHDVCLLEWFKTLRDNVSYLNVSFGNCPFCKAKLSTSFVELLNEDVDKNED